MKTTEWFSGHRLIPAHIGVYEVRDDNELKQYFQYWNGEFWGVRCYYPERAQDAQRSRSDWQEPMWRGLAEPDVSPVLSSCPVCCNIVHVSAGLALDAIGHDAGKQRYAGESDHDYRKRILGP